LPSKLHVGTCVDAIVLGFIVLRVVDEVSGSGWAMGRPKDVMFVASGDLEKPVKEGNYILLHTPVIQPYTEIWRHSIAREVAPPMF
jgi:hypothetical protein